MTTTIRAQTSAPAVLGDTAAFVRRATAAIGVDLALLLGVIGLVHGLISFGAEWTGRLQTTVVIDLSMSALPRYTLFSLSRGLVAYVFSLGFTLVYGFWAAKDDRAAGVLLPLLDILQSIPVLGFMPGLVLALVALFPTSNVGLELAAILMIFTGQAWNMTYSFYQSLRAIPLDQREVASIFGFSWSQRLRWVELPSATSGLVWNSMMSMAGGWFFLMINEAFVLGDKDFRLPGLGSYMSVAVAQGDTRAIGAAILAMGLMIVVLDQIVWRPLVAWAQKFRVEDTAAQEQISSWVLQALRRSQLLRGLGRLFERKVPVSTATGGTPPAVRAIPARTANGSRWLATGAFALLMLALGVGLFKLVRLLASVPVAQWWVFVRATGLTFGRVMLATVIATLWAVPAGLAIGLSPRLSRVLQPVIQLAASFPAPMLFPLVVALLELTGVGLGWGSIALMLLGTQWYVLFNVVAGATAIPEDLREAARAYGLTRWQRFTRVHLPAVFPYLVTGWVTAAGGAWNASIVTEYVKFKGEVLTTFGIGSEISRAAEAGQFPALAAAVTVMSLAVVMFNRTVWRRCYELAHERYALNR